MGVRTATMASALVKRAKKLIPSPDPVSRSLKKTWFLMNLELSVNSRAKLGEEEMQTLSLLRV